MKCNKDCAKQLLSLGLVVGILAGCGRSALSPTVEISPSVTVQQPLSGSLPTATFEDPFAWVTGTPHPDAVARVTAEAAHNLAVTHFEETMQSLPTADPMGPAITYEPDPTDVLPIGIILGADCEPLEGDPTFVTTSCWTTRIQNDSIRVRVGAGKEYDDSPGSIYVVVYPEIDRSERDIQTYLTPQVTGVLNLTAVAYPLIDLQSDTGLPFRFNLETRQWLDPNGTPIPVTATPTRTSEPTVATPTPAGGIAVTSLTLFDADTDQPLIGFDPMDTPTVLDFVALGTRRLNIRANTNPATVGSVRFSLDGAPYRIEGGAPYALQGNTGNDYAAWTPSSGQHQLVVTAFSGANATGTQGGSFTLDFTVVDTATATVASATATATGIPASITPVPATPTSVGSTSTPSTAKTALFVVGDATALNANDTAIQALLVGEGYTVSLKSAAQSSSADATGKQLVLISSSVAAGNVGTKFTSVAVPVIVWEHALYDDVGMTGPTTTTDYGTATGNTLVISNAAHGLAGGLSGTITVYTGSGTMAYGVPASSAISIAPQGSSNSKKVYFGYEQGVTMVGGVVAPARRVGLFLSDSGTLSNDGQTLVKAAFAWATGQ